MPLQRQEPVAGDIMFSEFPSVCPIPVNTISQECPKYSHGLKMI